MYSARHSSVSGVVRLPLCWMETITFVAVRRAAAATWRICWSSTSSGCFSPGHQTEVMRTVSKPASFARRIRAVVTVELVSLRKSSPTPTTSDGPAARAGGAAAPRTHAVRTAAAAASSARPLATRRG